MSRFLPSFACALALAIAAPGAAAPREGEVFALYSPHAAADELARRTQTPTTQDRLRRFVQASPRTLSAHSVDLGKERFDLYVPPGPPPAGGYGVLVWVPPHEEYPVPRDWRGALDRRGVIYVAARRSGNEQNVLDRRIPLALHAIHNVAARFPVDDERVYVGGFSGGSRTALRLALAWPDVFRGALLNAGSDVLGGGRLTLPEAPLLALVQERSRLVYATGVRDMPNRRMDEASQASARALCIGGMRDIPIASRGDHVMPDRRHFDLAMDALESPRAADAALPGCRERLQRRVDADLAAVEQLMQQGDTTAAGARLGEADQRWGGLAAPRSVELARRLGATGAADGR